MGAITCIYFIKKHKKFISFLYLFYLVCLLYIFFRGFIRCYRASYLIVFLLIAELYFKRKIKALFSVHLFLFLFLFLFPFMLSPESNDLKVVSHSEIAEEWNKRSKIPIHMMQRDKSLNKL